MKIAFDGNVLLIILNRPTLANASSQPVPGAYIHLIYLSKKNIACFKKMHRTKLLLDRNVYSISIGKYARYVSTNHFHGGFVGHDASNAIHHLFRYIHTHR
ncbi:Uncharacterised protein [Acinetobacter baumannii]|nr:Uncharacterised protein [Acinetobacter baumannii]